MITGAVLDLVSYLGFASYLVIATASRIRLKMVLGSLKFDRMPELVGAAIIELAFARSMLGLLFGIVKLASSVLPSFSAAASNVAQLVVSGPNFGGLSGVVYALVGCVWWLGWLKPAWGLSLPKPIVGFLLVWLVVGYLDVLPVSMANTAHTVGLICGCLFAWFLVTKAKNADRQ